MYKTKITIRGVEYIKLYSSIDKKIFSKTESTDGNFININGVRYTVNVSDECTVLPKDVSNYSECNSIEDYLKQEGLFWCKDDELLLKTNLALTKKVKQQEEQLNTIINLLQTLNIKL